MSVNDAPVLGIAPEHLPALVAALLVVAVLPLAMGWVRRACGHGFMPAVRFVRGYHDAGLSVRLAALLLMVAGAVHLALAFGEHAGELGGLFLLDGLALIGLSVAAFTTRWWRPAAVVLLIANIAAYTVVIGTRREGLDQAGMTTTLLELAALGLVLSPGGLAVRHRRLAWAAMAAPLYGLGIVMGGTSWIATVTHPAAEAAGEAHVHADGAVHRHGHTHGVRDALSGRGPALDQAAAERLAAETKAATARYADLDAAYADGYRGNFTRDSDTPHFDHPRYMKDSAVLDPTRPEQLVYVKTSSGPRLVGVVYVMPRPGERGPGIDVPGAHWHTHTICVSPVPMFVAGLMPPTGMCPAGSVNAVLPEMIHVWTVDNPGGPFAEELDKAYLETLRGQ